MTRRRKSGDLYDIVKYCIAIYLLHDLTQRMALSCAVEAVVVVRPSVSAASDWEGASWVDRTGYLKNYR